jgi:hypothetical protein
VYIHAERLLAKAGGSKCKGSGISHPWNEAIAGVERAERSGGLHKRSAEAWGNSLRARGAELPLGAFIPGLLLVDGLQNLIYHALHENRLNEPNREFNAMMRSMNEFGA